MPHAAKAARPGAERTCLGGSLRAVRGEEERHSEVQAATFLSRLRERVCFSSRETKGGKATRKGGCRCGSSAPRSATRRARPAPKPDVSAAFSRRAGMRSPFELPRSGPGHGRKSSKKKVSFVPGREPPRRAAQSGTADAHPAGVFAGERHAAKEGRPRSRPRPRPSRAGKLTFLRVPSSLEANRRKDARGRLLQLQRMRQVPHLDEGPRRRLPLL